ncbi:PepSY domain-containing protein [Chryseobacterium sp. SNU WT5]|uniref:PepSY-associated TM helix domain-containing protein n=1 Tax=Chryseobacterium sp. SNU WT5 TaxID=2594269 RepID=UPI00117D6039|nr:PepSY-associated TM helix domain-containing protein [Chryseobacterium sp. SNU WT5]QDP86507.1 PepSY domain-containing protein [Chryseobacterium sp. SNU WT5]
MNKKHRNKTKKSFVKRWIGNLHLWFGLGIGLIVFIVSITGALYVFKDEVQNYLRKDFIHHSEQNIAQKKTLPLKVLEKKVDAQVKEKFPLHWVDIPLDKSRSYQFHYYENNPEGWNYFNELVVYKTAYVNPFTGKVLSVQDEKNGFFNIVKFIHWSFLLKSTWGKYIVGIPVLLFLFMLISGIILWWPKNKKARKQRFWFQWKNIKTWRRKNYDLHSIVGFYTSFFALIFTITGLFYSYFFVQAIMYVLFSGGSTVYPDYSAIKTTALLEMRTDHTLDKIASKVEALYPTASSYSLDFGYDHLDDHEHPNYEVFVKQLDYSYHINHQIIFDENSGEMLQNRPHKTKNFGEKYVAANYDIHVGAILGIWGKIFAFIISLACASLPVTGFLVWWGRNNKKNVKLKAI